MHTLALAALHAPHGVPPAHSTHTPFDKSLAHTQVALTMVSDGADSLGTYVPLFAVCRGWRAGAALLLLCTLWAAWCGLGWSLVRVPVVARVVASYGRVLVPGLMVGLGFYIMLENGTQTLVGLPPLRRAW